MGNSRVDQYRPPLDVDAGLAADLYPIFTELVKFCVRAGRTETNAVRSTIAAMRSLGVADDLVVELTRSYMAGS